MTGSAKDAAPGPASRPEESPVKPGLDGLVVAETVLSHVDGEAGRLILRGYDLEEVAGRLSFEAMTAILWRDLIAGPDGHDYDEAALRRAFGEARAVAFRRFASLSDALDGLTITEGLRLCLSSLADEDEIPAPVLVTGATAAFTAALARHAEGHALIPPDPARGHAEDFLRMLRGTEPAPKDVRALDTYWVTVTDHGFNASTFTARVIASTAAGITSAVAGALCALKGPLHGGAPGPVLDMLDEIGDEALAAAWLDTHMASGERLMGFGHRIYKTRDPRADVLKRVATDLRGADKSRVAFAEAVEETALAALRKRKPSARLDTNVEFYTALALEALEIPREAFTPLFASARVAGWVAHAAEQEKTGRLIRPSAHYQGPWPERSDAA